MPSEPPFGSVRKLPIATVAILACVMLAGCLGGQSRTEWAFDITQIDQLAAQGIDGRGIRVGVLDTGINVDHASLDHLVDGDNTNGELKGYGNFMTGSTIGLQHAEDTNGHGSHVVGIMAARGSSFGDKLLYGGIDLKGGSPAIQLWVAKVCGVLPNGEEGCSTDGIGRALQWMRTQDLDIVSMSLGDKSDRVFVLPQGTVNDINALIDDGVVVIASAGNDGPDNSDVNQPSDIPGVISVGAIQDDGKVWSHSSRGDPSANRCQSNLFGDTFGRCSPNQKPEVVAPGVGILSAWAGDAYVSADGTSQATPFVTSVVALMLQGSPDLDSRADVSALKQALVDSAKPVSGQQQPHDNAAGYGIVQAAVARNAYQ